MTIALLKLGRCLLSFKSLIIHLELQLSELFPIVWGYDPFTLRFPLRRTTSLTACLHTYLIHIPCRHHKLSFVLLDRSWHYSSMSKVQSFKISQHELATILGIHRVSLSDVISDLRQKGIVATQYGEIIIKNPEALQKLIV